MEGSTQTTVSLRTTGLVNKTLEMSKVWSFLSIRKKWGFGKKTGKLIDWFKLKSDRAVGINLE